MSEEFIEEEKVGYINNLTPEELAALEAKKARAAAAVLAARERRAAEKAKEEFEAKKIQWKKKKAYVKGSKICEANRVYEDNNGWFVCEVCDKKFHDIEWVEEHVTTDKHKRNLEWYADKPIVDDDAVFEDIPDCVEWRDDEEIYFCKLCQAKAPSEIVLQAHLTGKEHTKRLANKEWHETQISRQLSGELNLPVYCEVEDDWIICRFCEKKMASTDMMITHLEGKEHAKKCANIGIAGYGTTQHESEAKAYVDQYGFDLWCRQRHWPDIIQETATAWKCTQCSKSFIVPSAVNDHLNQSHSGDKQEAIRQVAKPKRIPPMLAPQEHVCKICQLPFSSNALLKVHELTDPSHKAVAQRIQEPLIEFEDI